MVNEPDIDYYLPPQTQNYVKNFNNQSSPQLSHKRGEGRSFQDQKQRRKSDRTVNEGAYITHNALGGVAPSPGCRQEQVFMTVQES